MGSSSGEDYSTPPANPAPPSNMISPFGQSTGYQPNFINFLGDPGQPHTGLTPQMLAAIMGGNGPPPGPPGGMGGGGMGGPQQQQQPISDDQRMALARLVAEQNRPDRRWAEGGGMGGGGAGSGNRGGYGSSAGGRY